MFNGSKVLVTGGTGLIGSHAVEELLSRGAIVRTVVHRRPNPFTSGVELLQGDLREPDFCRKAVRGMDAVIHAAGITGGLNTVASGALGNFTDNLLMNTLVLEACRREGVRRYAFVSNTSVYPDTTEPLVEEMAWGSATTVPENHTGVVKRTGELQCRIYAERAGMEIAIVRGGNAYGPRDNFDLETSHVLPALVRKAVERQDPFVLWGSGETVRDFTHARDIARGILFLLEHHATGDPVNIATGRTVSIRELLQLILTLSGHTPAKIVSDGDRPGGSRIKCSDVSKMKRLGFKPLISLEEGLKETIEWYARPSRMR